MSQSAEILNALKSGRTITSLQGLFEFGAMQFPTRIFELRENGWPICMDLREVQSGKKVGHYSMDMNQETWPE